ncbi:TrbG/VirB9 family P-type conjugative transfer protein, partial [Caulobacter sp. 17J65-9]|uniref:TrbG/VirB9 family P-type conjugative transfer protein n=1 Tax=Caulobacter sp. 17J65-9 TaxID=2709382 RepID=UPI0013CBFC3D
TAACARGDVVYRLRFRYPPDPAAVAASAPPPTPGLDAIAPPETRNLAYTFTGSAETVPVRVFDNGSRTFFRWAEGASTPAVYARGLDEAETAVSFSAQGDYLVADQVAPAFVLRRGNAVAVLYNDAYQTPALDAGSPQPRAEAPRGPRWPFGRGRAQP